MNYLHLNNRFIKFQIPIILCLLITLLNSEEKGGIFYHGDIGELKDSTITVPDEAVAVSAKIKVDLLMDTGVVVGEPPSLFFIIDHSGSMYNNQGNDIWGKRFTVSLEFIDSIKAKFPSAEISIAVFRQHLYFDPADSSFFVPLTAYPQGAYMPFFKFDSSYVNNGGNPGWVVIQNILRIDTVGAYVDLEYIPTNVASNAVSTNINVAFAAAKHAFPFALYANNRQFIIFLSDGDATEYNGPNTTYWDFVTDVDGLPTTFTIFFTQSGQAPQNLVDMTINIQSNGYSTNNPHSNLWAIDVSNLMDVLMDYVMKILIDDTILGKPDSITINGSMADNYDTTSQSFSFDNHFPLTGVTTDFVYEVTYTVAKDSILPNGDTIVVQGDSTAEGNFSVVVDPSVTDPPDWYLHDFKLNCWDRSLEFYYNGNPVDTIYESMDTLEVRFIYDPGDAEYDYTNVDIEVTNTEGPSQDRETYTLTKSGNTFIGNFPRVVIDNVSPIIGDGTLQHYKVDTIAATFRNNENSKLPLDTIRIAVPFKSSTAIHPNTIFSNGKFSFIITKTGSMQNILRIYNLPENGKISLYAINGRKIFEQSLNRGNSSLLLPKSLSQAIYFLNLEYGNIVLREKILLR